MDLADLRTEYPPPFAGQPDGGDEGPLGDGSKALEAEAVAKTGLALQVEAVAKTLQVSRPGFSLGLSLRFCVQVGLRVLGARH